jgi:hypothetical protein
MYAQPALPYNHIPVNPITPDYTHPLSSLLFDLYSPASVHHPSPPLINLVKLKQRAKAAVLAEQNQLQQQYPIQHIDNGMRRYDNINANLRGEQLPVDLPPVYSAN